MGAHCDIGAFESRGFALINLTGTPQGTVISAAFANPLGLTVMANAATEPVDGGKMLKVSGPNLGEAYLYIQPADNQRWRAGLRLAPDAADLRTTEAEMRSPRQAWDAAFELFRTQAIV